MTINMLFLRIATLTILSLGAVFAASAAPPYRIVLFGKSSSGIYGAAHGIGPTGMVAGDFGAGIEAVVWNDDGSIRSIAPWVGAESYPSAIAVNGAGQALMTFNNMGAIFWDGSALIDTQASHNHGLNDRRQVVGVLFRAGNPFTAHAHFWNAGQIVKLAYLPGGGESSAVVINNQGVIAGNAKTADGTVHAVLWRNGTITDLGTLPGDTHSYAMNINEAGETVGLSVTGTMARPFRWSNGVMSQIGPDIDIAQFNIAGLGGLTGGHQRGMNNAGQIVAIQKINGVNHVVLWEQGVVTNLNPILGVSSAAAHPLDIGINDLGQILAESRKLVPTIPGVDMGVVMTGPSSVLTLAQGQSITYSLTITNSGTQTASGVTLTHTLPAGLTFAAATTSLGYCMGTSAVACALGNMAPGASANVQITATVTSAGTLLNTTNVTSIETDVNPLNNSATYTNYATAPVVTADLSVTMTDSPDPAKRRSNLTYSITVRNAGPDNAGDVILTDTLPASMSFVSASSSLGSCSGTSTVSCNLGTLASGASATVNIVVQPRLVGTYTNTVSVRTATKESSTTNNTASTVTTVR